LGFSTVSMKYFFSILFVFSYITGNAQATVTVKWSPHKPSAASDTIYYSPAQKLTWSDFKGKPEPGSDATAITSSGFGYMAGVKYKNGQANISITVYCYFSKQSSWVIKGKESDYALNHEQHHFDVTYIVAHSFFKKLKEAVFTWSNYNQLLDAIYRSSMKELETMQNKYDGETRNGRLPNIQTKWNAKIDEQLKALVIN
jgi:hypothetical protein